MKYAIIVVALLVGFLLIPSPVDSVAVSFTQPIPMEGALEKNEQLQATKIGYLPDGLLGGEDIHKGADGCIYTGVVSGEILKNCDQNLSKSAWKVIANTEGRPLGLHFNGQGELIIADANKGLLKLLSDNTIEVLADSYQGNKLIFTDDLDIAQDGSIYFSDASTLFDVREFTRDALSGRDTGRLFKYDPTTQQLTLLLDNLAFANGVAVAADDSFVLVNESWKYQVTRLWLTGEKAGTSDIFIDRIPGTPDGISRGTDGTFWLAIHGPRSGLLSLIAEYPFLKNQAAKVPMSLTPHPDKYGFVVQLSPQGEIIKSLQDPAAVSIWGITSVQATEDGILLGTLDTDRVGFFQFQKSQF